MISWLQRFFVSLTEERWTAAAVGGRVNHKALPEVDVSPMVVQLLAPRAPTAKPKQQQYNKTRSRLVGLGVHTYFYEEKVCMWAVQRCGWWIGYIVSVAHGQPMAVRLRYSYILPRYRRQGCREEGHPPWP